MKKVIFAAAAIAFSTQASAAERWKLLTITYDKEVRISAVISRHDCDFARARILGLPATPEEVAAKEKAEREARRREEIADAKALADAPLCSDKNWSETCRNSFFGRCGCKKIAASGESKWGEWLGGAGTVTGGRFLSGNSNVWIAECFR